MDFSPDFTYRYRAQYVAGGLTHNMTVRAGIIVSGGEAQAALMATALGNFFAAIQSRLMSDFEFIGAAWAYAADNTFTNTSSVPESPTGAITVTDLGPRLRATGTAMAGKSSDDAKGRLYFFGYHQNDVDNDDAGSDGWVSLTNDANIGDAKAIADDAFRAASGLSTIWYPRFTLKINDRALRVIRRTRNI
jgi:hypothetical protein